MIAVTVMTDGRDELLAQTVESLLANVTGPITRLTIYDDTGDQDHHAFLQDTYGPEGFGVIWHPAGRQGFGGAIRTVRAWLDENTDEPWQMSSEDDFVFERNVDLAAMVRVMEERPYLTQMALVRQAWNEQEIQAGGLLEANPCAYSQHTDGVNWWLQHRLYWTTNPSLFRRSLLSLGWPEGDNSEGRFHLRLMADGTPERAGRDLWSAHWGKRDDGRWITHVGSQRVGTGY